MYLDNNPAMDDPCCTFISKMLTVYMCNKKSGQLETASTIKK